MSGSVETGPMMSCGHCGATIYKEHIDRGLAGMWGGELLCPSCRKERVASREAASGPGEVGSLPLAMDADDSTAPVILPDVPAMDTPPAPLSGVSAMGGIGARHVRTFHAKLSEGAVHHLDEQVNTWLEQHPEIVIKYATTTVGVWEAKHAEPNLIMTLFY